MSVLEVNIPSRKLSGGIHFTGTIALPFFLQQFVLKDKNVLIKQTNRLYQMESNVLTNLGNKQQLVDNALIFSYISFIYLKTSLAIPKSPIFATRLGPFSVSKQFLAAISLHKSNKYQLNLSRQVDFHICANTILLRYYMYMYNVVDINVK